MLVGQLKKLLERFPPEPKLLYGFKGLFLFVQLYRHCANVGLPHLRYKATQKLLLLLLLLLTPKTLLEKFPPEPKHHNNITGIHMPWIKKT